MIKPCRYVIRLYDGPLLRVNKKIARACKAPRSLLTANYKGILKDLGRSAAEIGAEIKVLQGQYGVTVD
jgi:hypothetical protein